jgi:hypothetical protein
MNGGRCIFSFGRHSSREKAAQLFQAKGFGCRKGSHSSQNGVGLYKFLVIFITLVELDMIAD